MYSDLLANMLPDTEKRKLRTRKSHHARLAGACRARPNLGEPATPPDACASIGALRREPNSPSLADEAHRRRQIVDLPIGVQAGD